MNKLRGSIILNILLLITVTCSSQKNKNDLTELELKGKVKNLTETSYNVIDTLGEKKKGHFIKKDVYSFNEDGNIVENSHSEYYDKSEYKIKNKYNDKREKIESVFSQNTDNWEEQKTTYQYDEKGNIIESIWYMSENNEWKTVYEYDEKGNLSTETVFSIMKSKKTYKYDGNGNMIEMKLTSSGSTEKTIYKYDDNRNMVELNKYEEGHISAKSTYKYDDMGNKIEECELETQYIKNSLAASSNSCFTSKYNYDENGNWIKKIEFFTKDTPHFIIERVIEYYNK